MENSKVLKIDLNAVQDLPRQMLIEYIKHHKNKYPNHSYISDICTNCGVYFIDPEVELEQFRYVDRCSYCVM